MLIRSDCETCLHNPVCGFKKEYEKHIKAVGEAYIIDEECAVKYMGDTSVKVEVRCPHEITHSRR